jgi:protein-disulfide isomerase
LRIASRLLRLSVLSLAIAAATGCHDSSANGREAAMAAASTTATAETKDVALPGVDTSPMTPRERHAWSSLVTTLFAPCPDVPVSVSQCVIENRACGTCSQAAKWIARAVRDGVSESQIQHAYKDRFDPASVKVLPVDGSPTRGPEGAVVTLVEFADFECPHCAAAVPLIDAVMQAHPGKVRLIYKPFTLGFHTHGEPAARAALAAGAQGKFWEMEHLLFERQQHLEDADLERYAMMLKLDVPRWKADLSSPEVSDVIAKSHKLGDDIKLKGTPTIFVNGRELDIEEDESLDERVAAEAGEAPVPRAAPSDDRSSQATPPAPAGSAARRP